MKRVILFLLLFGLCFAQNVTAETRRGAYTLDVMGGMYGFSDSQGIEPGIGIDLRLGSFITERLSAELELLYSTTETTESFDRDIVAYAATINAAWHFRTRKMVSPYLIGGIGAAQIKPKFVEVDRNLLLAYGAGARISLGDKFAFRLEARHQMDYNDDDNQRTSPLSNNYTALAGFQLVLGGSSEAPAERTVEESSSETYVPEPQLDASVDADGDGIVNDDDQCPKTPNWIPVNENGCPKDSDKDTIFDFEDECPATPAGDSVDFKGCTVAKAAPRVARPAKKAMPAVPATAAVPTSVPSPSMSLTTSSPLTLNLEFDQGAATLSRAQAEKLTPVAEALKGSTKSVVIEGYTDSIGSDAVNSKLSQKRADAVKNQLVRKHGIDSRRIKSVGMGEKSPVADNATPEGRAKNRRIVIKLVE